MFVCVCVCVLYIYITVVMCVCFCGRHVKLGAVLAELTLQAVEGARELFESLLSEGEGEEEEEEEEGSGRTQPPLSLLTFDLHSGGYSGWQCVELLLTCLPLTRMLLALTLSSYKKVRCTSVCWERFMPVYRL